MRDSECGIEKINNSEIRNPKSQFATEFPVDRLTSPSDLTPQDYELRLPNLTAKAGERIYVPLQLGRSLALPLNEVSGFFAGGVTISRGMEGILKTGMIFVLDTYLQ